jgi:hypothetical protein|tara:strand:- start:66 stop:326 length:261 start_codon:yes stop_codon:yes gene_type:complete
MANYTVTISSTDEIVLNTDVLTIQSWIEGAVAGKINNVKKRLLQHYIEHCTTNEIQMAITKDLQVIHARELGLAVAQSEIDVSIDK